MTMQKPILLMIIGAVAVITGIVAFLWFAQLREVSKPIAGSPIPIATLPFTPSPETSPSPTPKTAEATVRYTDSGFDPKTVRIKAGERVTFENASSKQMWVASNPHPSHTTYPEFDAKQPYSPGESYTFTFEKKGTWGYHNHVSPTQGGTIIVE